MPFGAPVICGVSGRVFDHTDSDLSKILRSPERHATLAQMFGGRHLCPVSSNKVKARHPHEWSIATSQGPGARILPFAGHPHRHLYFQFALGQSILSGATTFHAETDFSTQPAQTLEEARLPRSHAN